VADADGEHAFSLISAGVSRATLDGEPVLDAWTGWKRGDTCFTYGCNEVVHRRMMRAGEVLELVVEFSTAVPSGDAPENFAVLRIGAARVLGEPDIAAAVDAARDADVAVVFAGLNAEWDNEGLDRADLDLPHHQNELISRVAEANPRTVVVLQSGSPLLLPWLDAVPAVLQAWYPGQECGNAIADVLLGVVDPGGRLPQSWPKRIEDTVAFGDASRYPGVDGQVTYGEGLAIGYRHHDTHGIEPRFAFGHGLSYSSFVHEDLALDRETLQPGETLTITVTVRNMGHCTGSEVVQLYVHDETSGLSRPPKAFAKVTLAPGTSRVLTMKLDMRSFAAYDEARCAWVAEAGRFEVRIGASAVDIRQRAWITLSDDWLSQSFSNAS
jgi:beta-glucosidase